MTDHMASKNMLKAVLGEYYDKGFRLEEVDNWNIVLSHNNILVKDFGVEGATIPTIHSVCNEYLGVDK